MRGLSPLHWLDLRDRDGRPDNQKILPALLFVVALAFHAWGKPLAWWELVTLGAIAFGPRMFGLYLRRSSFGFAANDERREERTETVVRQELLERRDPALGFDPAL